jgi:hypothetical protein
MQQTSLACRGGDPLRDAGDDAFLGKAGIAVPFELALTVTTLVLVASVPLG